MMIVMPSNCSISTCLYIAKKLQGTVSLIPVEKNSGRTANNFIFVYIFLFNPLWGGGSDPMCPPLRPSIFSYYSFWVHHPVNRHDWHLLEHAMASDFSVAWQLLSKRTICFLLGIKLCALIWLGVSRPVLTPVNPLLFAVTAQRSINDFGLGGKFGSGLLGKSCVCGMIFRHCLNLQLQRQPCSRLEPFLIRGNHFYSDNALRYLLRRRYIF
jgi:hypothetical protein